MIDLENSFLESGYIKENDNFFTRYKNDSDRYVENFGIQWEKFQKTQLDSFTGNSLTESRLVNCSGWNLNSLKGKLLLELGSGAGRFTEIFLKYGAIVVSVELSNAAYVNYRNNKNNNLFIIKDSLVNFNLKGVKFDYVFCYGVAQHVPNPINVYQTSVKNLKSNTGLLTIDHYWKRLGNKIPCFIYYNKYLWRPLTTKLSPKHLLILVKIISIIFLPFDIILKRIFPWKIYKIIKILIPIPLSNYFGVFGIKQDYKTIFNWCVMDTFDMLGAKYDEPWTIDQLNSVAMSLDLESYEIKTVTNNGNGLVLNGLAKRQNIK
tara:strand:- start:348 stop:1307 length:960 start_codon:yes stop_codon:yes gene_type:complete